MSSARFLGGHTKGSLVNFVRHFLFFFFFDVRQEGLFSIECRVLT